MIGLQLLPFELQLFLDGLLAIKADKVAQIVVIVLCGEQLLALDAERLGDAQDLAGDTLVQL
jgi:hypothetical protein